MNTLHASNRHAQRRTRAARWATALAVALAASLPRLARPDAITVPPVPNGLEVDAGNRAFLVGHATGTQNYICLPSGTGFAWSLFTPEATLFSDDGKQLITHYFAPNPFENGAIRATWQARDTSTVQAQLVKASTEAPFVAPNSIAWLKLAAVPGAQVGPQGGDTLTATTFIQRLNTSGGVAPATGCSTSADVGAKAFVPYTADYFFYAQEE